MGEKKTRSSAAAHASTPRTESEIRALVMQLRDDREALDMLVRVAEFMAARSRPRRRRIK